VKFFSERNPVVIAAVGVTVIVAAVGIAVNYDKLPYVNSGRHYEAEFAEAGGLTPGSTVQVSGLAAGKVSNVVLDGQRVVVDFDVDRQIFLGDRTEAAIKTKSLLGSKVLEITPRGDAALRETIPLRRTTSPYQLPDALGDLTTTISGLDTNQLSAALTTLSDTFRDTPPDVSLALQGVTRFSETLNTRDAQLRDLLTNARKATTVLADRSDQIVGLVANTNALLAQLRTQSNALDHLAGSVATLSQQLSGLVADNRAQLGPTLDNLNKVLTIVDDRKGEVQKSIKLLNAYAMSFGETLASGPFFKLYIANLLPGQFVQPFVDAAFSDLGLDPNVLAPSQRNDPQTGQPGTPALPVPYPRTGQGGPPRLTLPDSITGNPDDPRYPYHQPEPASPPGGPPPGPPALPAAAPSADPEAPTPQSGGGQ
jgi:phospholipid/cholesterol/gamma-HCH transport system substrate-binding protein